MVRAGVCSGRRIGEGERAKCGGRGKEGRDGVGQRREGREREVGKWYRWERMWGNCGVGVRVSSVILGKSAPLL